MMMVHHDNRGRPDQRCDGGDGPTCNRPPGVAAEPGAGNSSSTSSGGSVLIRSLRPFQYLSNTNSPHHYHTSTSLRSPEGMTTATAALGFPFTNQQWKELERQAMIYKYMMASLPVPRDLLFPAASATSVSQSPLSGGGFNLRLSNSLDPEPGRCKRTDGKKWRCSRDVAPDQKYCERHMHRGRPRSRKHVEIHASNTTTAAAKRVCRDNTISPLCAPTLSIPSHEVGKNCYPAQFFGSSLQPFHQTSINSVSSDRGIRGVEWMMKSEAAPMSSSDPQWQDLMQSNKTELSSCSRIPYFDANASVFGQRSEQECFLNLNSYTNFTAGDGHHQQDGGDCNMFLNPDVVALENPLLEETPRFFIDAWSKNDSGDNKSSLPSSGQLSPASLTLSMGGYNSISDEMCQTQMSLGCNDGSGDGIKPQISTWLTPSSWVSSPPGGPLAEVLKPTTSAASNPSSPITNNGNNGEFSSPLGNTVSSPSGVLQKTLASFSDSSGNSSPNLTSSKAKTEWLNQSKA